MSYPNPLFRVSYADFQNTKRAFADQESKFCDVYHQVIRILRRLRNGISTVS